MKNMELGGTRGGERAEAGEAARAQEQQLGKDAIKSAELLQRRENLEAQLQSMRKREFRDAQAKERNDQKILKKIAQLNDVLVQMGAEPVALTADSAPLKAAPEGGAKESSKREAAEVASEGAPGKAEASGSDEEEAAEDPEVVASRRKKEQLATWLSDQTPDLGPVMEVSAENWQKVVDPETGEVKREATKPGRKEFFRMVDGKIEQIADPSKLRDGQIVTDEDGHKVIYRIIKGKDGKYHEHFIDAEPDEADTPEEYAEFVRKARKRHAEAMGMKEEDLAEGEIDEAELEKRREEYREMLTGVRDRMGNRMFSEATINNIVENYDGKSAMLNPAEEDRIRALEAARDTQHQRDVEEAERILNGRDFKEFVTSTAADIKKLQAEIADMETGRGKYGDPDLREKRVREARGDLQAMQRKVRFVDRMKNSLDWDAEKDGKWFQMANLGDVDEMVAEMRAANEAEDNVTAETEAGNGTPEIVVDLTNMAAGGDLDLNNPAEVTTEQVNEAALASVLARAQNDPEFAGKLGNILAMIRGRQTAVDMQPAVSNGEAANNAEREKRIDRIHEKARHRVPFRRRVKQALVGVLSGLMALSMVACSPAVSTSEAEPGEAMAAPTGVAQTESTRIDANDLYSAPAAGETEETGAEELTDTRFEAESNHVRYDYSQDFASPDKQGIYNFGVDKSEVYGDQEAATGSLLEICRNQPETLASTASAFSSILRACGLTGNETPEQIDELISKGEDGAALQESLLEALAQALTQKDTEFEFYIEDGIEQSYLMENVGGKGAENTPENVAVRLGRNYIKRNNQKQVRITITYVDEEGNVVRETGDFNLQCGWQRNVNERVVVRERENPPVVVTTTPEDQPQDETETPQETETTETPQEPETSEDPEEPGTSEEPQEPETPQEPEQPQDPQEPQEPQQPQQPQEPQTPETPQEPETPQPPQEPEAPEVPPEAPEVPPEAPEVPPEAPEVPPEVPPAQEQVKEKDETMEQERVEQGGQVAEVTQTPDVTQTAPEAAQPEAQAPSISDIMNGAPGTTTIVGGAETTEGAGAEEGAGAGEVDAAEGGGQQDNGNESIQGTIQENAVADETASEEQQAADQAAQEQANQQEQQQGPTDQEFEDYIDSILAGLE